MACHCAVLAFNKMNWQFFCFWRKLSARLLTVFTTNVAFHTFSRFLMLHRYDKYVICVYLPCHCTCICMYALSHLADLSWFLHVYRRWSKACSSASNPRCWLCCWQRDDWQDCKVLSLSTLHVHACIHVYVWIDGVFLCLYMHVYTTKSVCTNAHLLPTLYRSRF